MCVWLCVPHSVCVCECERERERERERESVTRYVCVCVTHCVCAVTLCVCVCVCVCVYDSVCDTVCVSVCVCATQHGECSVSVESECVQLFSRVLDMAVCLKSGDCAQVVTLRRPTTDTCTWARPSIWKKQLYYLINTQPCCPKPCLPGSSRTG